MIPLLLVLFLFWGKRSLILRSLGSHFDCHVAPDAFFVVRRSSRPLHVEHPVRQGNEEVKQPSRKERLQERLRICIEDVEKLVNKYPTVLSLRSRENVLPTIDYLQDRLSLDHTGLKKVVFASPFVLGSQVFTIDSTIKFLQTRLNLSDKHVTKLVRDTPRLLTSSAESLERKLRWIQSTFELDDKNLKRMILASPQLLGLSVEDNLLPKVDWLQDRLDLNTKEDLRRFVMRDPSVFTKNKENLERKLSWFEERLGIDPQRVAKVIRRQPTLLSFSVDNLENKANWFQECLGFSDDELGKMVGNQGSIFTLSIEDKIEPQVCWIRSRFGLDNEGLRFMLCRLPQLLGYSIPRNLEPTMAFFAELLGEQEATRMVANGPSLVASSLEKRLKPRVAEATELGMTVDVGLLQRAAKYTTDKWGKSVENYALKKMNQSIVDGL